MKKSVYRKPYQEFKKQAVELLISSGKPCEQLARELGCSGFYQWQSPEPGKRA
jgi:transposase-like protein